MKIKADISILLPLLEVTTGWFFGDITSFNKACAKLDGTEYDLDMARYDGFSHGSLVWVRDCFNTNTIIHELTHLVDHVLEAVNVNDHEIRAYCMGYLGSEIFTAIPKKYGEKGKVLNAHV